MGSGASSQVHPQQSVINAKKKLNKKNAQGEEGHNNEPHSRSSPLISARPSFANLFEADSCLKSISSRGPRAPVPASKNILLRDWMELIVDITHVDLSPNESCPVGCLSVSLPYSVPLVCDADNQPIVAYTRFGSGRIVTFGHRGFLTNPDSLLDMSGTKGLLSHFMGKITPRVPPAITVLCHMHGSANVVPDLEEEKKTPYTVIKRNHFNDLEDCDVAVVDANKINLLDVAKFRDYLIRGGSLIIAASLLESHHANEPYVCPGNYLLAELGVLMTTQRAIPRFGASHPFIVKSLKLVEMDAVHAFNTLIDVAHGSRYDSSLFDRVLTTCLLVARHLPDTKHLTRYLAFRIHAFIAPVVPRPSDPLLGEMTPLRAQAFLVHHFRSPRNYSEWVLENAAVFPGLPEGYSFPSSKEIHLLPHASEWQGANVYALPNSTLTLKCRSEPCPCLHVRVGPHTDMMWVDPQREGGPSFDKSWLRWPEVTEVHNVKKHLDDQVAKLKIQHGGLVYFFFESTLDCSHHSALSTLAIKVSGGIDAPCFTTGHTTSQQWAISLSLCKAPWGELRGRRIIFVMPLKELKAVARPQDVVDYWDRVVDLYDDLSPRRVSRVERVVFDLQTSSGYIHAGYPIVCDLRLLPLITDVKTLRSEGFYPLFHALAHNYQQAAWTFENFEEVTCNLFPLYAAEMGLNLKPEVLYPQFAALYSFHPALLPPVLSVQKSDKRRISFNFSPVSSKDTSSKDTPSSKETSSKDSNASKRLSTRSSNSGSFSLDASSSPIAPLEMYMFLRKVLGWEAFRVLFLQYFKRDVFDLPKTNQSKIDEWIFRTSELVETNMIPFFALWGLAPSSSKLVSPELPMWKPMPPESYKKIGADNSSSVSSRLKRLQEQSQAKLQLFIDLQKKAAQRPKTSKPPNPTNADYLAPIRRSSSARPKEIFVQSTSV